MTKSIAELVKGKNHRGRPFLENAKVQTPITVVGGTWDGFQIRRARKLYKCDYGGGCKHWIERGQLYLEGELDPYRAGGFGHERYCLQCAGPMPLHAVAAAVIASRDATVAK